MANVLIYLAADGSLVLQPVLTEQHWEYETQAQKQRKAKTRLDKIWHDWSLVQLCFMV